MPALLKRAFYKQPTKLVAQQLLGKTLCVRRGKMVIRSKIVETEAYTGLNDPAAHSYSGKRTGRVETMYLQGGHAYVYFIYGMYFCFNVVTGSTEEPEAVLVRAVEILNTPSEKTSTNGPGKLCRTLGITKQHDRADLTKRKSIWIEDAPAENFRVVKTARVGIDYAGHAAKWKMRYYIKRHTHISRP